MSIAYVTGGNGDFFVTALALRESLKAQTGIDLLICDFGMTSAQCAYLKAQGWLLEGRGAAKDAHPWERKAALGDYVAALNADAVVWLDADTVVLGDIAAEVSRLLAAAPETDLFAAHDFGYASLKEFLAEFVLPDFTAQLSEHHVDLKRPYLNSGVFICRGNGFLKKWPEVTAAFDQNEILFEQNAFNVLAHDGSFAVEPLDRLVWNLHGDALGDIEVRTEGDTPVVTTEDRRAMVVHATSRDGRHHITNRGKLALGDHELPFFMKWFRDQTLRDHQLALLLKHLNRHFDAMIAHGVIVPKSAA